MYHRHRLSNSPISAFPFVTWRHKIIYSDSDCLQGLFKSMAREASLLITFPHLHSNLAGSMRKNTHKHTNTQAHKHKHTSTWAPQGLLHVWASTHIMYRRHLSRLCHYFCAGGPEPCSNLFITLPKFQRVRAICASLTRLDVKSHLIWDLQVSKMVERYGWVGPQVLTVRKHNDYSHKRKGQETLIFSPENLLINISFWLKNINNASLPSLDYVRGIMTT